MNMASSLIDDIFKAKPFSNGPRTACQHMLDLQISIDDSKCHC